MNSPWRNIKKDPPVKYEGAYCEFRRSDGSVVQGFLCFSVGFYGEDEYPAPEVSLTDQSRVDLFKFDSWRPVER